MTCYTVHAINQYGEKVSYDIDVASMLARGWSYCRLARFLGTTSGQIRAWCLKHGLKSKHKPIVRRRKKTA